MKVFLPILLILLPPECEPPILTLTEVDNNGSTTIDVGSTVEIHLQGNITSGYEWTYKGEFAPISQRYETNGILSDNEGTYIFTFEPYLQHAGKTYVLEFMYWQSWLPESSPSKTFTHTLTVVQ